MIDFSFLENFTKGDPKKMKRYISLYLKVAPEIFGRMRGNLENKEYEKLRINAHSLKPQTDFMGIPSLKELLVKIENDVKDDRFANLAEYFSQAYQIHVESEVELANYISNIT